ncbi:MAG: hypothetical protein LBM64_07305, partial [Deltaproteobacteria bacterium]|nr:hypothetical protein [Deltaproteobacteria bacterium]
MALTLTKIDATFNDNFGTMGGKMRAVVRTAGGVTPGNFAAAPADTVSLTSSMASGEFGSGTKATFNNSSGAITIDGNKLDLKGIANPLTERGIKVQLHNGGINVYTTDGTGYRLNSDGTQDKDANGSVKVADQAFDAVAGALIINNGNATGLGGSGINDGGDGVDMLINRQENAVIDAGKGNDTIFNFAKKVDTIKGGDGNDSIFSVGLSAGAIQGFGASADETGADYVKIISSMTGGDINMGKGKNIIDAAGVALSEVGISDVAKATSTALLAKSITNGVSKAVNIGALDSAVDVSTLAADLKFGDGKNSLVADTVKGVTITSGGTNAFSLKTVSDAAVS